MQPRLLAHQTVDCFIRYKTPIRFLLGLIGVWLGFLAQQSFAEKNGTQGLIRIVAATSLLLLIIPPQPITTPERTDNQPQIASGWRRSIGLAGLLVSALLFSKSFHAFYALERYEIPDRAPWEYFAFGVLTLIFGAYFLTVGLARARRITLWQGLVLGGIIGLALFLRLHLLSQMPYGLWSDEALNGLEAQRMLHQPDYRPIFVSFAIHMTGLHLWLYKTGLSLFGETSPQALRATSVVFGVGTVYLGYRVGSLLRGPNFGLLMAFFLAIMRWSLNFSRVAMTGIDTVFFTLLSYYFLERMFRSKRWRDALWLGLSIGLGLWFYSSFRFIILAFVIYGILRSRFWHARVIGPALISGIVILLAIFPILTFINVDEEDYLARGREVNIFAAGNREMKDVRDALAYGITRHLGMFHIEGDQNGRHNLPRAPMLDPIMGILMLMGVGFAVRNVRQPEEWFFLLMLVVAMLPGILTSEFEAPQALRTIGEITPVAYFCALTVFTIGEHLRRERVSRPLLAGLAALLVFSAYFNYDTYFNKQCHDYSVWMAFQSVFVAVAQEAEARPSNTRLYFSPLLSDEANLTFSAPKLKDRLEPSTLPDLFPVRLEATAPATIFLDVADTWLLDYAHHIYPNAMYRTVRSGDYGVTVDVPIFFTVDLSANDIASVQGLDREGRGVLYVPEFGEYRLSVPTGVRLSVDGKPVTSEEPLSLAVGNHAIQMSPLTQDLEWRKPGETTFGPVPTYDLDHDPVRAEGLLARFYPNADWQDSPVLERIDPALDMYFHELPLERPYSVIWSGWLRIDKGGLYGFSLRAVEDAQLWIDGEERVATLEPREAVTAQLQLARGAHRMEIHYQDITSHSRIHLLWKPPGEEEFTTLPPEVLSPTRPSRPVIAGAAVPR